MNQLNFWCRWCGSLTQHTIDCSVGEQLAIVKTTCSICGAIGSATMPGQDGEPPTARELSPQSPEVIAAIHAALRYAKVE
jgi:hypothetical protein